MRGHIDRLRGMFALLVMLGHAMDVASGSTVDYWAPYFLPFRPFLGFIWVVGFIVLSGYCIASACMRAGPALRPREYTVLRISRLFPLLWICLLVTIVLEGMMRGSDSRPAIWTEGITGASAIVNAFGLGGFYGQYGALAPAYTLSYELFFYVCWAVAWFAAAARPGRAIAYSLLSLLPLWALSIALPRILQPMAGGFVRLLFLCWILGAALAVYLKPLARLRIVGMVAPLRWPLLIAVAFAGHWYLRMPQTTASPAAWIYYPVMSLAFGGVILGYAARWSEVPSHPIDAALGVVSYPLFLIHGPVIIFTGYLLRRSGVTLDYGPLLLLLVAASVASAIVLALLVERPVMAFRAVLRRRLAPQVVPVPDARPVGDVTASPSLQRSASL